MKTVILAILLVTVSVGAIAKRTEEECAITANIYSVAADVRDSGQAPEVAFERIKQMGPASGAFSINYKKFIINTVYFQPAYSDSASILSQRIYYYCINERPNFQPLK